MPSVRTKRITAWLIASAVIGVTVLLIAIRPGAEAQQAACAQHCLPRHGIWAPDPTLAARDTSGKGVPSVCICN
ncbi:hypothetical protein ACQ859_21175 [Roseateles chitinivorans]|uniref:hypothetical protein n=1 Tax=Roseateles chitinivorans TaxID=2917965 RepID=UPI003D677325